MAYTLIICAGMFLGLCGHVRKVDYPSADECNKVRVTIPAGTIGKGYVICVPKESDKGIQ